MKGSVKLTVTDGVILMISKSLSVTAQSCTVLCCVLGIRLILGGQGMIMEMSKI